MRLDIFLFSSGLCESRTEAQRFIEEGCVSVCGKVVSKPAFDVEGKEGSVHVDTSSRKYVSRGGFKLEAALDAFGIDAEGKACLDIGASSGGFTDCLLQRGASHVIALDAGIGQLAETLRKDSRVTVMEKCNARNLAPSDLLYSPSLAVMDVSFISATLILPSVFRVLDFGGDFVLLIKPQFEVGKAGISKGGIVRDIKLREQAVARVVNFAAQIGFVPVGLIESPIKGGDGNTEYLAHFRKPL